MNAVKDNRAPDDVSAIDASAFIVAGYAAAVACDAPTPGGGSVAGVVGALAAALSEMVCHLSASKMEASNAESALAISIETASALRARLLDLAAADEAAYGAYVAATKLPKTSDREKSNRRTALQQALANAADVPIAVAIACQEILQGLERLAIHSTKHLISDVIAATLFAEAAARAALLNVEVNARMMSDKERGQSYQENAADIDRAVREQAKSVLDVAMKRL